MIEKPESCYEPDWEQRQLSNYPEGLVRLTESEAHNQLGIILKTTASTLESINPKSVEALLLGGSWALFNAGERGKSSGAIPVHTKSDVDFLTISSLDDLDIHEVDRARIELRQRLEQELGRKIGVGIENWSYSKAWAHYPSIWTHGIVVGNTVKIKDYEAFLSALAESGIKLVTS